MTKIRGMAFNVVNTKHMLGASTEEESGQDHLIPHAMEFNMEEFNMDERHLDYHEAGKMRPGNPACGCKNFAIR